MKAPRSFETSVTIYQLLCRNIPEELNLHKQIMCASYQSVILNPTL